MFWFLCVNLAVVHFLLHQDQQNSCGQSVRTRLHTVLYFSILILQAEKTSHKRTWRLLMLLPKRGPKAFSSFCLALRETEQQHLCDLLTQSPDRDCFDTQGEVSLQHLPNRYCVTYTFLCVCIHLTKWMTQILIVKPHSNSSLLFSNSRN